MAKFAPNERDNIEGRIEREIERLTKLLDGFRNSNSNAESIAARDFGDEGVRNPERITFHLTRHNNPYAHNDPWQATLGAYDLDDPTGDADTPMEAILNLLEMNHEVLDAAVMPKGWTPPKPLKSEMMKHHDEVIGKLKDAS